MSVASLSAQQLQQFVDDLTARCPNIGPCIHPPGLLRNDLHSLLQLQDVKHRKEAEHALLLLAKQCHKCCICQQEGGAFVNVADDLHGDGTALLFTLVASVDVLKRTVTVTSGGFMCGLCRAIIDTEAWVDYAAAQLATGSSKRLDQLKAMGLHFGEVNESLPEEILTDSSTLLAWLQELYCCAYALRVSFGAVPGWKLLGPLGQSLDLAQQGAVLELLQELGARIPTAQPGKNS